MQHSNTTDMSAGHLIVRQLEREGVRRVYGVPGESFLDVLDGLHDSPIRTVVTRHEGGAGFMALAEGRLTDLPGVAMVTRGPGAANAFIAVHTAWQDATPLVLFIGLIPVPDRGREAFQEFDLTGWFASTAKQVVTIDDPSAAARIVSDAFRIASSGRPGPVVIGLPEDVIQFPAVSATTVEPFRTAPVGIGSAAADELVARFERAQRPLIVVGGEGWPGDVGADLMSWAAERGIPVAADFRAYDAVSHDAPAYAGSLGYGRADSLAALFDSADLLVFVGTGRTDVLSDGYRTGHGAETVVVTAGEPLGHSGRVDQQILTTPAGFAGSLPTDVRSFDPERMNTAHAAAGAFSVPRPADSAPEGYADLDAVFLALREEIASDAVITYGAGNHALWAAKYLPHTSADSLVAPRNGAMGVGIPAAVAAALAYPGRQVVSVAGDGCFMMNGQEIATARAEGAAFIAIVVDNGIFATIVEHQEREYPERPSGTAMTNPDFAAFARSFGGHGETVTDASQFAAAFRRSVASALPAVIHVKQDPSVRSPRTDA